MNYYEHHLGDYAAATGHLSWDEDMAYTRLIRAYYHHEKPIPADMKAACRLARATTPAQRKAVESVLNEFFVLDAEGWHQKRCDAEIARYADKQAKAKRSAEARWNAPRQHTERNANASPNAMRTHCEGNAPNLQTPDTIPRKPELSRSRGARLPDDFEPDRAFADTLGIDADAESQRFADYWRAQPGQKGVKLDWPATWRNWCRNASERKRPDQRSFDQQRIDEKRNEVAKWTGGILGRKTPENVIDMEAANAQKRLG